MGQKKRHDGDACDYSYSDTDMGADDTASDPDYDTDTTEGDE